MHAPAALEPAPAAPPAAAPSPINRELSVLAFQRRVLALAENPAVPLLERLRFLCIVGSNLDEFFEIRVAGLKQQLHTRTATGRMPLAGVQALYHDVTTGARALINDQYALLNDTILPQLAAHGIRLLGDVDRTPAIRAWAAGYFREQVRPLLTPIGLDPAHPVPQIVNKSLNFIVQLAGHDAFGRESTIAIVKAPRVLPRVIRIPDAVAGGEHQYLLLSSIMHAHLADLFPGRDVVAYSQFRLTRDADLEIDEEDVTNLRQALQGELPQRQFGLPLRLEVAANCPDDLAGFLLTQFALDADDLYRCAGPVNIVRLMQLVDDADVPELKYEPFVPARTRRLPAGADVLECIRRHDVLLHHPYQSFDPVVEFLRRGADDPDVIAIKQTVYRTGINSALMEALIAAALRGKEVTVVVELMARFDEETNINWAQKLEDAGAQVVYGVFGLKTHAKLALMLRREVDAEGRERIVPYAHLGTGNYHPRTTKLYTDFGLLTADPAICSDINEIFLHITSLARTPALQRLLLAPFTMQAAVVAMIRREAAHARAGRPARIVAKMNALLEEGVIAALQEASQAGVDIDLIVRGACALRPGVHGFTDRIRVRSLLGRFLEHPRIWYFRNGRAADDGDVWLSSADWMGRNFFGRIEVAFPVTDPVLKRRVVDEGLKACLRDNCEAWELAADGQWTQLAPGDAPRFSAQEYLLARLQRTEDASENDGPDPLASL
ncbi:MAG: polyphosphate kinase 1 [Proteobacteria bacterium]|nr:polyphosphate kinase 1 [Pseudomonadota bacterium]